MKTKQAKGSMRKFTFIIFMALIGFGGWFWWTNQGQVWDLVGPYIENGDFLTLEARYTADSIMANHRKELLGDEKRTYQEPSLKFYPYVLMEVKYTDVDRKSREGVLLWGLMDGEMVIDTDTWDKSHGFEDAILANATAQDFKVLNALAKNNGTLTQEQLLKELHLEAPIVESWVEQAQNKYLITKKGNLIQLHFQNPKILVKPNTKITQHLVTKPYSHAQRISTRYSKNQIQKIASAAFGDDFIIRRMTEVFLPVYIVGVLNPDGSILTSYWNALNGQRIHPNKFLAVSP